MPSDYDDFPTHFTAALDRRMDIVRLLFEFLHAGDRLSVGFPLFTPLIDRKRSSYKTRTDWASARFCAWRWGSRIFASAVMEQRGFSFAASIGMPIDGRVRTFPRAPHRKPYRLWQMLAESLSLEPLPGRPTH